MNPQIVNFIISIDAERFPEIADELIKIVEFATFINMSTEQRSAIINQIRNVDTSYGGDIKVRLATDMSKFPGQGLSADTKAKMLAEYYIDLADKVGIPISITLYPETNVESQPQPQPQRLKPSRPQHTPINPTPAPETHGGIEEVQEVFRLRGLILSLETEIQNGNQDIEALKREVAKNNKIIEDVETRNKKREDEIDEAVETLFKMGFMLTR